MSMRSTVPVLLVLAAALAGCGGGSRTDAAAAASTKAAASGEARKKEKKASKKKAKGTQDEFVQMRQELGLTPDQEVAFSARLAARNAAVQAWKDGPEGKRLAAARTERTAATDPAKQAALDAEITRLNQAHWKVRTDYRSQVMAVLTPDQQRRWAGTRLGDRLLKQYGKLDLDEGQQQRVRAIANDVVGAHLEAGALAADPYLSKTLGPASLAAEKRIEAEVLTEAQRKTLAERRAPKAAAGAPAER